MSIHELMERGLVNFPYTMLCFTVGGEATDPRPNKIYQSVRVSFKFKIIFQFFTGRLSVLVIGVTSLTKDPGFESLTFQNPPEFSNQSWPSKYIVIILREKLVPSYQWHLWWFIDRPYYFYFTLIMTQNDVQLKLFFTKS